MLDEEIRPKLLLADDSVTIRKVVELTFADEGIDVTTAADAASAMEKFVETQPDIVLVDVGLAGTSGYQICEMIKQDDATKHIPVLLLVGSFEPFDQEAAEAACADGFLTKPFESIRELVARVKELLRSEEQTPVDEAAADTDAAEHQIWDPGPEITTPVQETSDIEDLYQSSFADTVEIEEYDTVDDLLGDAGLDDELIEASYGSAPIDTDERGTSFTENFQTKDFEWKPAKIESDEPPAMISDAVDLETTDVSDTPEPEPSAKDTAPATDTHVMTEPSPEFVALVAQRVVEKLSDKVIREIAKDAVPRIAEKLIREALVEDNKA